jgi:hypothetical protein
MTLPARRLTAAACTWAVTWTLCNVCYETFDDDDETTAAAARRFFCPRLRAVQCGECAMRVFTRE